MPTKFTTSVNIIRDANRELNYIVTANSLQIANQISNDFKKGIRSFNLIGSYGTGKSAFIWALEQTLSLKHHYFNINLLPQQKVGFINIVGEYGSIKSAFEKHFGLSGAEDTEVFSEIYNAYYDLEAKNCVLIIAIDEMGKFLEYAANNNPEKELYFIQKLAEFVNNPDNHILLLTTVHQNIDSYAYALNIAQKHEWSKVKGRFNEITFNEPVEQLLFLAASYLEAKKIGTAPFKKIMLSVEMLKISKPFSTNHQYAEEIADKLFPLDIFSAHILTLALQRYGQNERSLFSFLESSDPTGIDFNSTNEKSEFYHLGKVYEYLVYNFYSFINSPHNPDISAWRSIQSSIETTERSFNEDIGSYISLIQTIGLLNIFAANGAKLGRDAIAYYGIHCLGIANSVVLIANLEKRKIIHYRNYSDRFILFEGTDLDIQLALFEAGNKVEKVVDITGLINKYYQLPPITAKQATYVKGTPRLFEYVVSEEPKNLIPKGEIDGYINLVFSEHYTERDIIKFSQDQKEAIVYGFYKNSRSIKDLLFEIEKTKKVIEENIDDKIAVKELNNIILHQQNLLNHKILNNFYNKRTEIVWIFAGKVIDIPTKKAFNQQLSNIVNTVYSKAPVFKNELVNKNKISPSVHTAKRNYLKALTQHWDKPQLNFPQERFPAEKTIYLSLLENNGLQLYSDDIDHVVTVNDRNGFNFIWDASNEFLESAKASRRSLTELMDLLSLRPFKLKQGLIDFWVVTYLFIKRDDFSLFYKGAYVPSLNEQILEIIIKEPDEFELKAFDIGGVKLDLFNSYRLMLQQSAKENFSNKDFVETIKPFLTFYKSLPDYSKNTRRLSREALLIREAIVKSRDPEQTFFEDFPAALGYNVQTLQNSHEGLQSYIGHLQGAIKELRTSYSELVNRIENYIQTEIVGELKEFPEYKLALQNRYAKIKKHLLLQQQQKMVQRINSELNDKVAWLNSVIQMVSGVTLEKFTDDDELAIYDKLSFAIMELDSLTNISKENFSEDREDIIKLEISSFKDGLKSKTIRLPKQKAKQVQDAEDDIRQSLTSDRTVNIAALTKLLNEILNNNE